MQAYEAVIILGSGPLGLYALALDRGVEQVQIIGGPTQRLELALAWGATHVLDFASLPDGERVDWVRERTDGRGPDVVINCARSSGFAEALRMVRPGGRVVHLATSGGPNVLIPPGLLFRGVSVVMPVMAEARHFLQAIRFVATRADRFDVTRLISNSYTLSRAGDALRAMAEFREIKPVFYPHRPPAAADVSPGPETDR